jgi:hypothetical protein
VTPEGVQRSAFVVLVLVLVLVVDCFPHEQNDHDDEYDLSVGIRF